MSDLKANLARLETAVPALAQRLGAVAHAAEAFEHTASTMLQQFAAKEHDVEKLTQQVRQALTDLHGEGTDAEGAVRNQAEEADARGHSLVADLHSGREQLMAAVEDAGQAYEGVRDHLAAGDARMKAAHGEAHQAMEQLESGVGERGEEVAGSTTDVTDALVAVSSAVEAAHTGVGAAMSALEQRMSELLDAAQHRIDETKATLAEAASASEGGVGEATSDLVGRKDTLFQQMHARVESELRQRLDAALQSVVESLALLAQTVTVTRDGLEGQREAVAGEFGELARRIPPLNAGVDSVKEAAQQTEVPY